MKTQELVLTKENVTVVEYKNLKTTFAGREGSKELFDIAKLFKQYSKETGQFQSCFIPKMSALVLVTTYKHCTGFVTKVAVITLPKQDELGRDALLRIVAINPFDLYFNSHCLSSNPYIESLTYTYTVDQLDKEHNKYEVVDVDTEGLISNILDK